MAATWKVRRWDSRVPDSKDGDPLPLTCPGCDTAALCPTAGEPGDLVIAILGLRLIFDHPNHQPPDGWMPDAIECRKCGRVFESDSGGEDVRKAV